MPSFSITLRPTGPVLSSAVRRSPEPEPSLRRQPHGLSRPPPSHAPLTGRPFCGVEPLEQRRLLSADPVVAKQEFAEAIDAVEVALADDAATETKVAAYAAASQTLTDYVDLGAADAAEMVADVDAFSATGDLLLSEVGDAPTDVVTDYVDALRTGMDGIAAFDSLVATPVDPNDPPPDPGDPAPPQNPPTRDDWDGDGTPNIDDPTPGDPEAGGFDPDDVDGDGDKDKYDNDYDPRPGETPEEHHDRLEREQNRQGDRIIELFDEWLEKPEGERGDPRSPERDDAEDRFNDLWDRIRRLRKEHPDVIF